MDQSIDQATISFTPNSAASDTAPPQSAAPHATPQSNAPSNGAISHETAPDPLLNRAALPPAIASASESSPSDIHQRTILGDCTEPTEEQGAVNMPRQFPVRFETATMSRLEAKELVQGSNQSAIASHGATRSEVEEQRALLQREIKNLYIVGKLLGQGQFGLVFEAYEPLADENVAIKVLNPRVPKYDEAAERFRAEMIINGAARQAGIPIVELYSTGQLPNGAAFFVMRKMAGSLDDIRASFHGTPVKGGAPIVPADRDPNEYLELALKASLGLCDNVHKLHEIGYVHRDIKPQNALYDAKGQMRLSDLGLALELRGEVAEARRFAGSPAYMPPEVWPKEFTTYSPLTYHANLSRASDIYALGATMATMIWGQHPFAKKSGEQISLYELGEKVRSGTSRLNLDEALDGLPLSWKSSARLQRSKQLISCALNLDPAKRPHSAEAMAQDIKRILDGRPIQAGKSSVRFHAESLMTRGDFLTTAAALIGGAGLAGAWQVNRNREHQRFLQGFSAELHDAFDLFDAGDRHGALTLARQTADRTQHLTDAGGVRIHRTAQNFCTQLTEYGALRDQGDAALRRLDAQYLAGTERDAFISQLKKLLELHEKTARATIVDADERERPLLGSDELRALRRETVQLLLSWDQVEVAAWRDIVNKDRKTLHNLIAIVEPTLGEAWAKPFELELRYMLRGLRAVDDKPEKAHEAMNADAVQRFCSPEEIAVVRKENPEALYLRGILTAHLSPRFGASTEYLTAYQEHLDATGAQKKGFLRAELTYASACLQRCFGIFNSVTRFDALYSREGTLKQYEAAHALVNRAAGIIGETPIVKMALASVIGNIAYTRRGDIPRQDFEEALRFMADVGKEFPGNWSAPLNKAALHLMRYTLRRDIPETADDLKLAREAAATAGEIAPTSPRVWALKFRLAMYGDDNALIAEALNNAIKFGQQMPPEAFGRVLCDLALGCGAGAMHWRQLYRASGMAPQEIDSQKFILDLLNQALQMAQDSERQGAPFPWDDPALSGIDQIPDIATKFAELRRRSLESHGKAPQS